MKVKDRAKVVGAFAELFNRYEEQERSIALNEQTALTVTPKRISAVLRTVLIFSLVAGAIGGTTAAVISRYGETCTFADGTVVPGRCMYEENFNTLSTTVWDVADDWPGPLLERIPDASCFRHENATVSGGILSLRMSNNARASCPQTWTITPFYNATYATDWTPGATTTDNAVISWKTKRFTYGHLAIRMKLPPGRGPGGDISLWGTDCQRTGGVVGALSDLFTLPAGSRNCDWPEIGSAEMDIIQSSRTGATTIINTSIYTAGSPGTPVQVGTWFSPTTGPIIDYFGARYAQPFTAGFSAWLSSVTVENPTTAFHVYELIWTPREWRVLVDGNVVAKEIPTGTTWIPSNPMFVMIWNASTVVVTPGDLPSDLEVDWLRIWCDPPVTQCTMVN